MKKEFAICVVSGVNIGIVKDLIYPTEKYAEEALKLIFTQNKYQDQKFVILPVYSKA